MLSPFPASRPPSRQALLPGESSRLVRPSGQAPGRPPQLHAVPADDPVPTELVHQPGGAGHRRSAVAVRFRYVPRSGAALLHCHPGRQDPVQDDQLERCLQLDFGHTVDGVFGRIDRAGHLQAVLQVQDRLSRAGEEVPWTAAAASAANCFTTSKKG